MGKFKEYVYLIKESVRIFREAKEKLSRCIIYEDVFIDHEYSLYYGVSIYRVDGPRCSYYRYRLTNYNADIDIQTIHIKYNKRLSVMHIFKLLLKRKEK